MSDKKWFGKGIYDRHDKPIKILDLVIGIIFLLIVFVVVFAMLQ